MPAAKLTPEQWAEVRRADEQGVDIAVLCQQWGLKPNAIRQRRHREGWVNPRKVHEEAMVQETRRKARAMSNASVMRVCPPVSALSVTAENLNSKAHEGSLIAASMFLDSIAQAFNGNGILPPQNGRELYTAMKGLRHAAGMDKEGLAINIGAFFGTNKAGTAAAQAQTRDVTPPRALIIAPST